MPGAREGEAGRQRTATTVGDYVPGMPDRYAMGEYRRVTELSASG